ncbi:MAG: 1-(5-phosphoribosyl)-5-[(5-phosphoribosylamino)methylideneamino]imidazole-4-carboxamide isomerase [Bacilli bacterium]
MLVLPAIDLYGGLAVRLRQGDFANITNYGDPVAIAQRFAASGATHLHVVDLQAARSGQTTPDTGTIVREIVDQTDLLVEIGGGVRSLADVERWLERGVWRCVLGTAAVRSRDLVQRAIDRYGTAVTVGVDARDGAVATAGWLDTEQISAHQFAIELYGLGLRECIYTDISRDGMLSGANVDAAVALAQASGLRVVVSGGVRNLDDIRAVRARENQGLSGVIAGKAIYEETLDVAAALRVAEGR